MEAFSYHPVLSLISHFPSPASPQQGLGAVEALSDPRYEHLDQLLSLEKQLVQAISDPEETSPFTQVDDGESCSVSVCSCFVIFFVCVFFQCLCFALPLCG